MWLDFLSCTTRIDLLENEDFLNRTGIRTSFTIECKNAKDIRLHSMYSDENESLLLPATQFEVLS